MKVVTLFVFVKKSRHDCLGDPVGRATKDDVTRRHHNVTKASLK